MAVRDSDGNLLPYTQPVTQADLDAGRIRIPIPGGLKQEFFPAQDCDVQITLNGERLTAAWRPKFGPDRERSGVLHVPKATLQRLVAADEVLHLHRNSRKDVLLGDRGSKLRIQQWINRRPDELTADLRTASPTLHDFLDGDPTWLSPVNGHRFFPRGGR